jgi:ATP-dependent DNA ligase
MSVLNKMIIKPMFAKSSTPFDSQKHVFELKWDGSRCIVFVDRKSIRLQKPMPSRKRSGYWLKIKKVFDIDAVV